jgi:hypothetical protein
MERLQALFEAELRMKVIDDSNNMKIANTNMTRKEIDL